MRLHGSDLTGRCHAQNKPAARGEQLLRHQDGKGCADSASDNPVVVPLMMKYVEIGMIARPLRMLATARSGAQMPHDIAIGIKNAHYRDGIGRQTLLPTRLSQQVLGRERGWCVVFFACDDRRDSAP